VLRLSVAIITKNEAAPNAKGELYRYVEAWPAGRRR
jgi:hypothetical protein